MQEVLAIFSAQIKKNKNGEWVSTDLNDFDFGAPGGKLRIVAANYLYQKNFNRIIITSGGRGHNVKNDEADRPDLSLIMKRELIEMGVPEKAIIEENKSNTTFEQLEELQRFVKKKEVNQLIIISNIYHLPRTKAMIEDIPELAELKELLKANRLKIEAAEDIIMDNDQENWQEKIESAYQSERMQEIIQSEGEGVKQIKEGIYKYK